MMPVQGVPRQSMHSGPETPLTERGTLTIDEEKIHKCARRSRSTSWPCMPCISREGDAMKVHQAGMLLGLLTLAGLCVSACSGPEPHRESDGLCGGRFVSPVGMELGNDSFRTIQWTPDGSRILFSYAENVLFAETAFGDAPDIYAVHVSGELVHKVLDLPPAEPAYDAGDNWMTFDLSADGTRIAYARCAVSEETIQVDDWQEGEWQVENAEIFVSSFDGSNVDRLTNNTYLDALPAWSPDGESIAYISDPDRSILSSKTVGTGRGSIRYRATTRITIHEVATGESREIGLPAGLAAAPIRLEWSPGGDRIAFVVLEGEWSPWNLAVYTVGVDETGLTRVSDAGSGPAWSPDGETIAMVVPEGERERDLYTFAADGSNPVEVNFDKDDVGSGWWGTDLGPEWWMGNLSWSPDGSSIFFERFGDRVSVATVGNAGVEAGKPGGSHARGRAVTAGAGGGFVLASPPSDSPGSFSLRALSPDGTQIASRTDIAEFFRLSVKDLQGNARIIVDWERSFR